MYTRLSIFTNKTYYKKLWITLFIINVFLLGLLYVLIPYSDTIFYYLKGLIILTLLFTMIMFEYAFYRVVQNRPMAIITSSGIVIKQFDLIPWSNIIRLDKFLIEASIAIYVKDISLLKKQASLIGKLIIWESQVLRTPTIVIDNINVSYKEILMITDEYINDK